MDILDFLLSNSAYSQYIVGVAIIGLFILFVIVRGIGGLIYYAIFPSKRTWRTKPLEEEENRNKPISDAESIGSISMRLGEDIRDVWVMGYSNDQIDGVLTGKYTLEEMYKMAPEGNTISPKGKEILGK
ncbi:MAG TPA: hypothetical protein VK880_05085 [Anaerolineales bacterium]|nr:hypothetical protein [Anaerolineales bacterium]